MHSVTLFIVRPILLHLGTDLAELLSRKIVTTSKRNFKRARVSMRRKIRINLISFRLTRAIFVAVNVQKTTESRKYLLKKRHHFFRSPSWVVIFGLPVVVIWCGSTVIHGAVHGWSTTNTATSMDIGIAPTNGFTVFANVQSWRVTSWGKMLETPPRLEVVQVVVCMRSSFKN